MDVALSFDLVARLLLVILAVLWVAAMARQWRADQFRARWRVVLVRFSADTSQFQEAIRRAGAAAREFTEHMDKLRAVTSSSGDQVAQLRAEMERLATRPATPDEARRMR